VRKADDIIETLAAHRDALENCGVQELALFGSCARGEAGDASDLDFVVRFERKSFDGYMDLKHFLEDVFACRVDLVIEEAIKPRLREAILREAIHAPGLS